MEAYPWDRFLMLLLGKEPDKIFKKIINLPDHRKHIYWFALLFYSYDYYLLKTEKQ